MASLGPLQEHDKTRVGREVRAEYVTGDKTLAENPSANERKEF